MNYKRLKRSSNAATIVGMMDAADRRTGGSIVWTEQSGRVSDATQDLTRCPRCGSIDIAVERHTLPF